jgi:ubiquinone/menaquinone biosynthesis C-methylase UbiE
MNIFNKYLSNLFKKKENIYVLKKPGFYNKSTKKVFKFRFKEFNNYTKIKVKKRYDKFWKDNFDQIKINRAIKRSKIILDCGVGTGNLSFSCFSNKLENKTYIANDINFENLKKLKNAFNNFLKKNFLICSEFKKIPLKKNSVDLVFFIGSLHHDNNPFKSLKKIISFIKSNGELILWVYKKPPIIRRLTDNHFRKQMNSKIKFKDKLKIMSEITKLAFLLKKNKTYININQNLHTLGIKKGKFNIQEFIFKFFLRNTFNPDLKYKLSMYENFDWFAPLNNAIFEKKELVKYLNNNGMKLNFVKKTNSGISIIANKV